MLKEKKHILSTFSPKYQLHCLGTKQISNKWIIAAPFHGVNDGETKGQWSDLIQWKDLEKTDKDLDLGLSKMAQKIRVPAENPSLIPSTNIGWDPNSCSSNSRESDTSGFHRRLHPCVHIYPLNPPSNQN